MKRIFIAVAFSLLVLLPPGCGTPAEACQQRASALFEDGYYELAITQYNQALTLQPDYRQAFNNRGVCYAYLGDYDSAVNDFNTAFGLDINCTVALHNREAAYRLRDGNGQLTDLELCREISSPPLLAAGRGEGDSARPLLLVHGFQATRFDPAALWAEMALYFTGRDVTRPEAGTSVAVDRAAGEPDGAIMRLEGNGYVVYISNYTRKPERATRGDIRRYARNLADEIAAICEREHCAEVDIVAHSSGGLVARAYIEGEDLSPHPYHVPYRGDVGKLIMLATPNHGTYLGDLVPDTVEEIVEEVVAWETWAQVEVASPFLLELNGGVTGRKQGVEYWAVAGNTFRCGTGIEDPAAAALCVVTGQQDNDGAVTVASVALPCQGEWEEIPPSRWFVVNLAHVKLRCREAGYIVEYMLSRPEPG